MNREWIISEPTQMQRLCTFLGKVEIDKPLKVAVSYYHGKRTNTQNARLWLLHTAASEVTGYSPEEMHEHALCRHYGYDEREVTDPITKTKVTRRIPLKRSSGRDKKDFAKFMEATEIWYGTDFGVWLE